MWMDRKFITCTGRYSFGSIASFRDLFDPKNDEEDDIVIDFRNARMGPFSVAGHRCAGGQIQGSRQKLHLVHLSRLCVAPQKSQRRG